MEIIQEEGRIFTIFDYIFMNYNMYFIARIYDD